MHRYYVYKCTQEITVGVFWKKRKFTLKINKQYKINESRDDSSNKKSVNRSAPYKIIQHLVLLDVM